MLHVQKFPLLLVLKIMIIAMEIGSEMGEMVTKEAEALLHLDKNDLSFSSPFISSRADKSCKGVLSCSKSYLLLSANALSFRTRCSFQHKHCPSVRSCSHSKGREKRMKEA